MIHTFLPTIAFCFEQKTLLKNILQDITENFSRRSVLIHSLPIKHPQELTAYAAKSILPDILVFSDFSDSDSSKELLRNILFLKSQKPSMILISTSFIREKYRFLPEPFLCASAFSRKELWNCVCSAYDLSVCDSHTFSYYHRPMYQYVPIHTILYFTSELRCIRLVTECGSDSFYGKLNEIEEILRRKDCRFVRIHQSYLVNAAFIRSCSRRSVTLLTGEELRISTPGYYSAVRKTAEGR